MVQVVTQTLAILAGGALVHALLRRLGADLRFAQSLAVAALVFLAVLSGWFLRDRWNFLDDQRGRYAGLSPRAASATCAAIGVDGGVLAFVGSAIPVGERFYMERGGRVAGNSDICIRFLLLPRVQVASPDQARYLVHWEAESRAAFDQAVARGGTVIRRDRKHFVVRKP
jgi:hypothetical protein